MDEELRRWASDWKRMEVREMKVVHKLVSAHRLEAAVSWLMIAVGALYAVGVPVLACLLWRVHAPLQLWLTLGVVAFFGTMLVPMMLVWRRQMKRARDRLTASPLGLLLDLIAVRERELFWWVDRRVIAMNVVMSTVLVVFHCVRASLWPMRIDTGLHVFLVVFYACLIFATFRRVPFLRRELKALYAMAAELTDPADDLDGPQPASPSMELR